MPKYSLFPGRSANCQGWALVGSCSKGQPCPQMLRGWVISVSRGGSSPYVLSTVEDSRGVTKVDPNLPCRDFPWSQETSQDPESCPGNKLTGQKTLCTMGGSLVLRHVSGWGLQTENGSSACTGHGSSVTLRSPSTSLLLMPTRQCAVLSRHTHSHRPTGTPVTEFL